MIPYAILMMKICWDDGHSLEIRVLEPTSQGITFRTVRNREADMSLPIRRVNCYFLNYEKRIYEEIILSRFCILRRPDLDDPRMESIGWELDTKDQTFHQKLQGVLKDYMAYIDEQLDPPAYAPGRLGDVELALVLDQSALWNCFLDRTLTEFYAFYWEINRLTDHFITKQKITHLYIGNSFCYHPFPETQVLDAILEKCLQHHLIPVIVLSSMPEFRIVSYRQLLEHLDGWCRRHRQMLELVINDFGISLLLQEMEQEGMLSMEHFPLTMGGLLNKRKKDPRMPQAGAGETSIHAPFYRAYLKERLQIRKFSYEAGSCEVYDGEEFHILHLPLYQTNTAGFCTLYALCRYGDRGRQEIVRTCPRFCETHQVEYPGNSNIIGRYNSLFGESRKELNDLEYLRALTRKKIQRLVVRR